MANPTDPTDPTEPTIDPLPDLATLTDAEVMALARLYLGKTRANRPAEGDPKS